MPETPRCLLIKMNPVYFPFTYIPEPIVEALASCFGQTIVYQAMTQNIPEILKTEAEKGVLEIRTPVTTDEQKLTAIIRDYKNWGIVHQGAEKSFLKFQKEKVPFFDDTSEIKIRSDIKKYKAGKTEEKDIPDTLLNSRIFLQIAQEFDMQNQDVNHDLDELKTLEQQLIKHLHDDEPEFLIPKSESLIHQDTGAYMTSERLEHWADLIRQDSAELSGIFITHSPSVLDLITDKLPDLKLIHHWNSVPIYHQNDIPETWQNDFMDYLQTLTKVDESDIRGDFHQLPEIRGYFKTVSLKLYLIYGKSPYGFFNQLISKAKFQENIEKNIKNTLVILMEFYPQ
jgi:hypothetical protein